MSQIIDTFRSGQIENITIYSDKIRAQYKDGTVAYVVTANNANTIISLFNAISSMAKAPEIEYSTSLPYNVILYLTPAVIVGLMSVLVMWFIFRQAQGSSNAAMSFGRSRARMFSGEHPTVTFQDIGGTDKTKEVVEEIIKFIKDPQIFIQLGARIPKGILISGPSGCGKTLLAKAVSSEAGVPFFSISATEFIELFLGVGASRVRDLFDQAKRHSPCIVYIDRVDALGNRSDLATTRILTDSSEDKEKYADREERIQTLGQLLIELDGFDTDTNVIVLFETDRPDLLDPALLRSGRIDRHVKVNMPDQKDREAILKLHVKGKPLEPSLDIQSLAKTSENFSGSDIENWVNESTIRAAKKGKISIGMDDFQEVFEEEHIVRTPLSTQPPNTSMNNTN